MLYLLIIHQRNMLPNFHRVENTQKKPIQLPGHILQQLPLRAGRGPSPWSPRQRGVVVRETASAAGVAAPSQTRGAGPRRHGRGQGGV